MADDDQREREMIEVFFQIQLLDLPGIIEGAAQGQQEQQDPAVFERNGAHERC